MRRLLLVVPYLVVATEAFLLSFTPTRPSCPLHAIASPSSSQKIVVVGPEEGIASDFAAHLRAESQSRAVVTTSNAAGRELDGASVVVVAPDAGDGEEMNPSELLGSALSNLPPSCEYLVYVNTPETEASAEEGGNSLLSGLLGGTSSPLELIRSAEVRAKTMVMHTGSLFGEAGGQEPVPFLTGPKAEPVLDRSYVLRSVLLGPGPTLSQAKDAATKRASAVDCLARVLSGKDRPNGSEFSVVSTEGAVLNEEQWEQELSRLDVMESNTGIAVFAVEFDSIKSRESLSKWLVDSWGPSTLRQTSSIVVRSGSRPVRVAATDQGAAIIWESLSDDMNIVCSGKLEVVISEDPASLTVLRTDGTTGASLRAPLAREEEIIESLAKSIASTVYPKGLATPMGTGAAKVREAAAAAAAAAEVASGEAQREDEEEAPAASAGSQSKGRGRRAGRRRS
ncbi:unnamed protein product [Chrysoparadoxa australica]